MSESATILPAKSTIPVPRRFRRSGTAPSATQVILRVFERLFPFKTDVELSARIGLSDRYCRKIIAEEAGLTSEGLAALLQSEEGLKILEALMGDAKPTWWRKFRRQMEFAEVRRLQAEAAKRLDALERGEIE